MVVYHINLGKTRFEETWDLQKRINLFKQKNNCNDIIISNEHEHVYTLGKSGDKNHLLLKDKKLIEQNISYFEIDRGGDLTYHGPGQLVIYPIFNLTNYYKDSHKYLRDLENVIISTLNDFNIDAYRDEEYTGVWVKNEKICAIGIKVSKWITMHGLAFNINNDLKFFDNIIPCGIFHKGVTSLKRQAGKEIELDLVLKKVINNFEKIFEIRIENINNRELDRYYK
jgi:lipoyl(octanoyl) transferase